MKSLADLQTQVYQWSLKNFGDQPAHMPLLGIAEEVGELCHAFLKAEQNIRMDEDHLEQAKDAVGDIVIYLADFCARYNLDLEECVWQAWAEVEKRDWKH